MSFMGEADDNVNTVVGFEKGPLGPRMGSCEHGGISADTHLPGQPTQRTSGTRQACLTGQAEASSFTFSASFPIQESQGYRVNDVDNTERLIHSFGMVALQQCVFLPNFISGSEHILINKVEVLGARGSLVLGTTYRPPTKHKAHTWIIKSWLYGKHKSGFPGLSARKVETQWIAVIHAFVF